MEVNGSQATGPEGGETRAQDAKVRGFSYLRKVHMQPVLSVDFRCSMHTRPKGLEHFQNCLFLHSTLGYPSILESY